MALKERAKTDFLLQVKTGCHHAATSKREPLVAIRRTAHTVEASNQNGVSVSCDLLLDVCSLTLDGWLHGRVNKE